MSAEITSGELFYRYHGFQEDLSNKILIEQLRLDCDYKFQQNTVKMRLQELRKLRELSRKSAASILSGEFTACLKLLHKKRDAIVSTMKLELDKLDIELEEVRNQTDAGLLQWVLQYYALIRDSLTSARVRLFGDAEDNSVGKRQAQMKRDLKLFAFALQVETKGSISLTAVSKESSQFKRCCKAVGDSMGSNFSDKFPLHSGLNVIDVYKLDHSWLSARLQNAASRVESAKVKGLFCSIPQRYLYPLCAYGMHTQRVQGLQTHKGLGRIFEGDRESQIPRMRMPLFSEPWFCSSGDSVKASTTPGEGNATASASPRGHRPDFVRAKRLADAKVIREPRFSRSSAPTSMARMPVEELAAGTYLALCRVLIARLRVVDGEFEEMLIAESSKLGYDAIYSSLLEEYVLLNADHVLPEFIMHVQLAPLSGEPSSTTHPAEEPRQTKRPDLTSFYVVPAELEAQIPIAADIRCGSAAQAALDVHCRCPADVLGRNASQVTRESSEARSDRLWNRYRAGLESEKSRTIDELKGNNNRSSAEFSEIEERIEMLTLDEEGSRASMILRQNLCLNVSQAPVAFAETSRKLIAKLGENVNKVAEDL